MYGTPTIQKWLNNRFLDLAFANVIMFGKWTQISKLSQQSMLIIKVSFVSDFFVQISHELTQYSTFITAENKL